MLISIPAWNSQGVIAPIDPIDPTSILRSPYEVSLPEVVRRFATSLARIAILQGFLEYRAALQSAGLNQGFQWLNGSFMENKEAMLGIDPGDIDVATYFYLPAGESQTDVFTRDALVFGTDAVARKKRYKVDAYLIPLEAPTEIPVEDLVWNSHYWSGLFGHSRRNFIWKGFLQVDLSSGEDAAATALLSILAANLSPKPAGGATP